MKENAFPVLTSDIGSFPLMSTEAWPRATVWQRLRYRISRHPLTILGADPNDNQRLYNRMQYSDDEHLKLLLEYGLGQGSGRAMVPAVLSGLAVHRQARRRRLFAAYSGGNSRVSVALGGWGGCI